jgi:hypothetical protein
MSHDAMRPSHGRNNSSNPSGRGTHPAAKKPQERFAPSLMCFWQRPLCWFVVHPTFFPIRIDVLLFSSFHSHSAFKLWPARCRCCRRCHCPCPCLREVWPTASRRTVGGAPQVACLRGDASCSVRCSPTCVRRCACGVGFSSVPLLFSAVPLPSARRCSVGQTRQDRTHTTQRGRKNEQTHAAAAVLLSV